MLLLGAGILLFACDLLTREDFSTFTPQVAAPASTEPSPTDTATSEEPITITPAPTIQVAPSLGSIPDPANYSWEVVTRGFDQPIDLTNAGDGTGRIGMRVPSRGRP